MGPQPAGTVYTHHWSGTQQQRHLPLPTWAGFKLAAEREEETILYCYLSPCFPFVTTIPVQSRKTQCCFAEAARAHALSWGQPGLSFPCQGLCSDNLSLPPSPNWVKCKREKLREQQDFVSQLALSLCRVGCCCRQAFNCRKGNVPRGAASLALRRCCLT